MLMDQTSPSEIVNIAPGEGQIPVSFTSEPNWEGLAFPKDYSTGKNHFNEEREIPIIPQNMYTPDWNNVMIDLLVILSIYFIH